MTPSTRRGRAPIAGGSAVNDRKSPNDEVVSIVDAGPPQGDSIFRISPPEPLPPRYCASQQSSAPSPSRSARPLEEGPSAASLPEKRVAELGETAGVALTAGGAGGPSRVGSQQAAAQRTSAGRRDGYPRPSFSALRPCF